MDQTPYSEKIGLNEFSESFSLSVVWIGCGMKKYLFFLFKSFCLAISYF